MRNIEKYFMLTIGMYILLGMISSYYYGDNPLNKIDDFANVSIDYKTQITDENSNTIFGKLNEVYETTIGNTLKWGKMLLDLLWYGLNPFSVGIPDEEMDNLEQLLIKFVIFFRSLLILLTVLETYLIIKNRKS